MSKILIALLIFAIIAFCVKSSLANNDFLAFQDTVEFKENLIESTPKKEISIKIGGILKCIKNIAPIAVDVKNIIATLKGKTIDDLIKELNQLDKDGKQLYSDCWKIASNISNISFMGLDEASVKDLTLSIPAAATDLLTCINDVQPVVSNIYNIGKCVASSDKECLQKWVDQITADGNKLVADCKKVIQ